jgi:tetratricopeptide (TPR) repeat protein
MRKYIKFFVILVLIVGCGGDNLTGPSVGSANRMVSDGWGLYKIGEYNSALSKFNGALKLNPKLVDVYNGLGWTHFALNNIKQAVQQFNTGAGKNPNYLDVIVGSAFSSYENNDYSVENGSLKWALKAIEVDSAGFDMNGVDYTFSHNPKVTAKELRKIIALSYFYIGKFEDSYNQLKKYLNGYTLDPKASNFPSELLKELERVCKS